MLYVLVTCNSKPALVIIRERELNVHLTVTRATPRARIEDMNGSVLDGMQRMRKFEPCQSPMVSPSFSFDPFVFLTGIRPA